MTDVGSVQRSVRFPAALEAMIGAEAVAEKRSFSQMLVVLADEALAERNRRWTDGVVGAAEAARSAGGSQSGPVSRVLAGLGEGEPDGDGAGSGAAPSAAVQAATVGASGMAYSPSPSSALQERDGDTEPLGVVATPSRSSNACSFDTPKGIKCKACGKVH